VFNSSCLRTSLTLRLQTCIQWQLSPDFPYTSSREEAPIATQMIVGQSALRRHDRHPHVAAPALTMRWTPNYATLLEDGAPVRWLADEIHDGDLRVLDAKRGDHRFQTKWEASALLVAIRVWHTGSLRHSAAHPIGLPISLVCDGKRSSSSGDHSRGWIGVTYKAQVSPEVRVCVGIPNDKVESALLFCKARHLHQVSLRSRRQINCPINAWSACDEQFAA
jgi:hypothetical protein